MDERLEQALNFSNYMVTLNNQRRALKEKFLADLVYYHNGGSFLVTKELINFVKTMIDTGNEVDVVFIDDKDIPIEVADVQEFLSTILNIYFYASNYYYTEYEKLKKNRTIEGITT
jgi:hypothetical protein